MRYIWKRCFAALLAVALVFTLLPGTARAEDQPFENSGGDGTSAETAYQIATAEQLKSFREYINTDSGHGDSQYFKLTADIDLEGGDGNEWTPIGDGSNKFNGTFDGNGHTISGLYINAPTSDNQGLFGTINKTVSNLRVEGSVTGKDNVGGIAGTNSGTIENCSSGVTVKGANNVGGITGNNGRSVKNCYNNGDVTGSDNVGGVVGNSYSKGTVTENCYNTGTVTCSSGNCGGVVGQNCSAQTRYSTGKVKNCYNIGKVDGGTNSGGIVGINRQEYSERDGTNVSGIIDNCYYLTGTAKKGIGDDQTGSGSALPKNAAQFKTLASTLGDGWEDSPFLCRPMLISNREVPSVEGKGTENEPYEIPDLATLEAFRDYINADNGAGEYFKLTNNIDMSGTYNASGKSWTPIGDSYAPVSAAGKTFRGTFDGDGHEITGLYIKKTEKSDGEYQGLFGKVGFYDTSVNNPGIIKNLTVSGTVTGYEDVGGIAGIVYVGTIENCVSNVTVTATNRSAGGIAGSNQDTVKACISTGAVSAVQYAGGLVGTSDGTVINCYNTANISCTGDSAGGIAGFCAESGVSDGTTLTGAIKNCYSVGKISGPKEIGGITGACKNTCDINNCYWVFYPNTNTATSGAGQGSFTSAQIAWEYANAGFANGKIAWLLNHGDDAVNWGQKIGSNPYPVFDGEEVYRVAFTTGYRTLARNPYDTRYTNSGGTVTLPEPPEGWLSTDYTYLKFDRWSTANSIDGPEFTDQTPVTADTVVYAVGRQTFGGESDAIALEVHEDETATVELDQYMAYQSKNPAAGKFEYTITSDAGDTKASVSGSTLTVPAGLKPGTYEIAVTATEKEPDYALMSVGPYGVEPVTLTVRVVVSPHVSESGDWVIDEAAGQHYKVCDTCGKYFERSSHSWTLTSTDETTGDKTYACDICGTEKVVEGGKYCVSGKVLESDGTTPSGGTQVALKRGGETVAESVTDSEGRYAFPGVEPGIYDLVVGDENGTTTVLVEVTEDTPLDDITELPANVSSVLEVTGDGTPSVVVGGLDDEARASAETEPGKTVTVTMTVEAVTDGAAGNTPDLQSSIDAIKSASESSGHEYLDLTLEKTVSESGADDVTTEITETTSLITVVIPFDPSGKRNIVVYRYHSGSVDTLTQDENNVGEHIDVGDSAVTVYAKNFSTYAIGYSLTGQMPTPSIPPFYGIAVPAQTEGGSVKADRATALPGSRVTLTVTPNEGYHLGFLTVSDRYGKPVGVTDNGNGTYTFTMPYGKVTVEAEFVKCGSLSFTDLDVGAWYHDYADYVINHGLMRGTGGGLFEPDGTVTRAQMVTVLWNMRDNPVVNYYMTYSDVSEDAWYTEAIRWAASEGIANGYGNGKFGPDDPITREQMAVMLYRYEKKYGDGGFTGTWMYRLPFTDLEQISDWAFEAVAWCNMKDIITGKDERILDPKGPAKRSEMAAVLTRYSEMNVK